MARQALFAPSDPIIGKNKERYIQAIRESLDNGSFFSGVRAELMDLLLEPGFLTWPQGSSAKAVFIRTVRLHPDRYAAGVFRTIVLFAGVKARVNENRIFRDLQWSVPKDLGAFDFLEADAQAARILKEDPRNAAALAFRAENEKLRAETAGKMPSGGRAFHNVCRPVQQIAA